MVEWFCQIMGSEVGPLSQRQLVDMVRQHQINPEDLVRRNNSAWVPAFDVKGLFAAAAKPPTDSSSSTDGAANDEDASGTSADSKSDKAKSLPKDAEKTVERRTVSAVSETGIHGVSDKSDWFCIASGEKKGPLGFLELKAMAEKGALRERDRVWRASWPKFQKAAEVEGLHPTQ